MRPILLAILAFLPSALTRMTIATVFVASGWGKLHHLERTIEYFASLGVPMPQLQAPMAAGTELICGALILVGLATRAAALPLIVIMLVAIRAARWEDLTGAASLAEIPEYLYVVLLFWLATHGAGRLSLDHWIGERIGRKKTGDNPA